MDTTNQPLTRNEWIAVAISVAVVLGIVAFGIAGNSGLSDQNPLSSLTQTSTSSEPSMNEPAPNTPSVTVAPGVTSVLISEGNGDTAVAGKTVAVNYIGRLEDGTVFDTSLQPGRTPLTFQVGAGQMIPGFDKGVVGMKVGEQRRLTLAPEAAYGAQGVPGVIPANATLTFDVELVSVQ